MLERANHYTFISNHMKQLDNLFKENFEGFKSEDSDYYLKEDIPLYDPVLEGIAPWFLNYKLKNTGFS